MDTLVEMYHPRKVAPALDEDAKPVEIEPGALAGITGIVQLADAFGAD